VALVLLAVPSQEDQVARAVRSGIRCLVLEDGPIDELVRAIHAAYARLAFVSQIRKSWSDHCSTAWYRFRSQSGWRLWQTP